MDFIVPIIENCSKKIIIIFFSVHFFWYFFQTLLRSFLIFYNCQIFLFLVFFRSFSFFCSDLFITPRRKTTLVKKSVCFSRLCSEHSVLLAQ